MNEFLGYNIRAFNTISKKRKSERYQCDGVYLLPEPRHALGWVEYFERIHPRCKIEMESVSVIEGRMVFTPIPVQKQITAEEIKEYSKMPTTSGS